MANSNEFLIELQAKLDEIKSKSNINSDIGTIQDDLDKLKLKAEIDPETIQSLTKQLEDIIKQKITISNINIDQGQAVKTGQQAGQLISDSAEKAISKATSKSIGKYFKIDPSTTGQLASEMEKLVRQWTNTKGKLTDIKINTRTSFDENAGKQIERLHQATVTYKNELDEVNKKTIAWSKIGTKPGTDGNVKDIYGFVEVAGQYSKSLDTVAAKTNNFADQQKKAVTDLSNQLKQLYKGATDPKAPKPIKDSGNLAGLENQYNTITDAINKMGSASQSAFSGEHNTVKTLISDLKIMIREYRNAETVATSLRSKDIATVKSSYSSKLDVLATKMQSSGLYSKGFQKGADNLKNILNNATDSSGLTQFLNGLDKLEAGYKRAEASAKAFNQSQKVGIKVSGLESHLADLQRISPEISNFKTQIDGADVSVQSLLTDLGNVKTKDDFSVISEKARSFEKAAKAAGIAVKELGTGSESLASKISRIQGLTNGTIKNDYSTQIAKLEGNFRGLGLSQDEISNKIKNVNSAFSELKQKISQPFDESNYQEIISLNDKLQKELAESSNEYSKLQAASKGFATTQQRLNKANEIEAWNQKNSNATKEAIANNNAYIASLRDLNTQMTKTKFNEIANAFKSSKNTIGGLDKISASLKKLGSFVSVGSGIMFLASKAKDAVSEIKELDNTLTEISKTSDITTQELKDLGMSAYDTASKYGRTASDYLSGVESMSQSGFYGEKGTAMAEQSLLAQAAGDMSQEIADKYVIATNAAYKFNGAAEKINAVLDGQNSINKMVALYGNI